MKRTRRRATVVAAALAAALPVTLGLQAPQALAVTPSPDTSTSAAESTSPSTSPPTSASPSASPSTSPSASTSPSTSTSPSASTSPSPRRPRTAPGVVLPFGPACSSLPRRGEGSLRAMARERLAIAASHNPDLSVLVSAARKAGLVRTLNNGARLTLFAPTNEAFAKIPKPQRDRLLNDRAQLEKVLKYHVVNRRITPRQLPHGTFRTLEGAPLTTSGSGRNFKVNGTAKIVCGNIRTANATVYLIDTVLMPK
ncbi:fasciclin domain-containing protein [Streptomyces sp. JV176]|uniref:fasciclin domain-containing protein n=2 Tax=Streptomyces TaxID=1883 RepID=UPI002E76AE60|nr:fasciclin domain-containing protein [Streptomyces sp. JV176]MEE1802514.1 fasciclin domain-containing protein [Streptomyces sp. JV176]